MSKKAIVIGAGIGGLSAAIRLRKKNYDVEVFEKNSVAGGKLTEFELGSYRFDFGPSLFTMPQYVEELFTLTGKDPTDYFTYESLDEACRYFYPDGLEFVAPTDKNKFAEAACETFDIDKKKIEKYFTYNENIFNKSGKIFLTQSVHKLRTFLNTKALNAAAQSYVIELFRTMNAANIKRLKDPRLVQLFNRYATYNGSSPYKAPAILNSISILEHLYGTYYPHGGMSSISNALYKLAIDLGVKFHFNKLVDKIEHHESKVSGVSCEGKQYEADIITCNMDVSFCYDRLLSNIEPPSFYMDRDKSSSALIFYWGIRKSFPNLGLHNIFFAENYKAEFSAIFDSQNSYEDPTVYINNTSFLEKTDAPEGCSNWFVMINVPAKFDIDIKQVRENVLKKLSKQLKTEIEPLIEEERIVTPQIIESQTLSHKGALYGSSSNNWVNAFLRHPNFSSKLKGLYFVGGSVHPGGGIPLCLLSSKIATELIDG